MAELCPLPLRPPGPRWRGLRPRRLLAGLALLLAVVLPLALVLPLATPAASPPAVWVTLEGRPVLELRRVAGAQKPQEVASRAANRLRALAEDRRVAPESLVVREDPPYAMIGLESGGGFQPLLAVDDRAAADFGLDRQALAERYRDQLRGAIRQYRSSHSLSAWLRGTALALAVLLLYLLWLRIQGGFNARLAAWLAAEEHLPLSSIRLGSIRLLDEHQMRALLQWLRSALHWSLLLLVSYLLLPLLLGLFPPTQAIAEGLRSHMLRVVEGLLAGVVGAIPNLVSIALILAVTAMAIRASNAWFSEIARGRLQIPGFYPEWAQPTQRLVAGALLLAGVVIAYPYVPGSNSRAFQGAGIFVGVLAALGSSAVATNVISGLMLIYTRAFREGDRVEINGVVGVVQDSALLVTRVLTPRNELVSIPNATVIGASITNYSLADREIQRPVALATTITIGYDVPWRQVHALMLAAADSVPGICADPPPRVLQTALNDFHISYELNACVHDVDRYRETLSELLGAIQDHFAAAGVEILSPGYHALRDGSASTVARRG
ncbi:MAG: mechanosensitive ion channel domain-containing protein [Synechococcaceae cyanobacterium]|nr:mechanosensitive ion channel domain-containing protein [Synechococcaceae cyanobacterium]